MEFLQHLLHVLIEYAVLGFEFVGISVMIVAGVKNLFNYVRKDIRVPLVLAKGIAMGLEFLLIGEILRTVVAHDISDIIPVACIVVIRVALTILVHWEIKEEEREIEHEIEKHKREHNEQGM